MPSYVVKRDGRRQEVKMDNITKRMSNLMYGLNTEFVDPGA